jgi:hypothetical protein
MNLWAVEGLSETMRTILLTCIFTLALCLAHLIEIGLFANTFESSPVNNLGMIPIHQDTAEFNGLVFFLGNKSSTYIYDNETQLLSYRQHQKEYYLGALGHYMVGFPKPKVSQAARFSLNMDGTLWIDDAQTNTRSNIFRASPQNGLTFGGKTYRAIYINNDAKVKSTQEVTLAFQRLGNFTDATVSDALGNLSANSTNIVSGTPVFTKKSSSQSRVSAPVFAMFLTFLMTLV